MKIKMLRSAKGVANSDGSVTTVYETDSIIDATEPWLEKVCANFLESGHAVEIKIDQPTETKKRGKSKSLKDGNT